ncbi:MAG: hypothetical protein Q9168_006531 [Polycauliona sp. 1 TL-2023]
MAIVQPYNKLGASSTFHDLMRLLQFLSAIIALGLFSRYVYQLHHHDRHTRASTGAVEGILSVALLYTLAALLLRLLLRNRVVSPLLRWLHMALDLIFMILFITVAALTRPNGGSTGQQNGNCHPTSLRFAGYVRPADKWCNLPTGVFTLAILSTFFHFLTALFHEIKEIRAKHAGLPNEGGHELNNNNIPMNNNVTR